MSHDHERDKQETDRDQREHETLPAPEAAGHREADQRHSGNWDTRGRVDTEVAQTQADPDELGHNGQEVQQEQIPDREPAPETAEALIDESGMPNPGH